METNLPTMEPRTTLPSLLLFGPQTALPPQEVMIELQGILVESPLLGTLRNAVRELPLLWESLLQFDPSLKHIPGVQYMEDLAHWVNRSASSVHNPSISANVYALPLTVLLHIAQYVRYLDSIDGEDPHRQVLQSLSGGVQGFCVGFLTAIAVGCSKDKHSIAYMASMSLRLAVCIGAYIEQDGSFASPKNNTNCIAIRWNPNSLTLDEVVLLLSNYPEAYVSCFNDDSCITVTATAQATAQISEKLQVLGLRVKGVAVQGRFHSFAHIPTVEKILKFYDSSANMEFPRLDELQSPLRSTIDSEVTCMESLLKLAAECILLKPANWFKTVEAALLQIPVSPKYVAFAGFGDDIPASLRQNSSLSIIYLNRKAPPTFIPTLPEQPQGCYPPIAIVGMAGRFPGADDLDEFWQLLIDGTSMVQPAPAEKLNLPAETKWWGNFLRNTDAFDHRFFNKSSREALAWDPQQRILLEVAYEALESSGYFGVTSKSSLKDYGCYIGAVMSNYYDNISCHSPTAYATSGTSRCFFSGAVSHYFGWTGPALTIDTACSSSLVAINAACRAINSGECSRAIAGGTNIFTSPFDFMNLQAAGFLSPNGQCKPFDSLADGYCRGEGVGVLVLKPLPTALAENDKILGVIAGSACNQNQNLCHITVPHSESQVNLYKKVMGVSGITPESVSYVEAHGTGTGVGDPIEVRSIKDAFGGHLRDQILHFSSVKGNIGHTEATAGAAGLLKVLLMMHHGLIPPQASLTTLSPKLPPFVEHRMVIPREVIPWASATKIACINSYGAAGSNCAVIIRSIDSFFETSRPKTPPARDIEKYPLLISAASLKSLSSFCNRLMRYLDTVPSRNVTLADLTFNLCDRANHALPHRLSTTITSVAELKNKLALAASGSSTYIKDLTQVMRPVILVFPGQENNFIGVSDKLYRSSVLFKSHLDQCDRILTSLGFESLYPAIFQKTEISNIITLHAALFSVQYASAKCWMHSGVNVSAVIGHSFGQLTAICVSGALSLEDSLKLVTGRASIMITNWGVEKGSMMWMQADRKRVAEILGSFNAQAKGDDVDIACYNGPKSHVVVGSCDALKSLQGFIESDHSLRDSIPTKILHVTHGYHSRFTDLTLPHIEALAKSLSWKPPTLHLEPCDAQRDFTRPNFMSISDHMRRPVFFEDAVKRLAQQHSGCTWLEIGHGSSVTKLLRACLGAEQDNLILPSQLTTPYAEGSLAELTVSLWNVSYPVQYWLFHRSQKPQYKSLVLPPYQFEKIKFWLPFTGRGQNIDVPQATAESTPPHELLVFVKFTDARKNEATFRIEPRSDRFQILLKGHVMGGQSLAPASLSFELASRAAMALIPDNSLSGYVPRVESLEMKSPIGLDGNKEITLCLTRLGAPQLSWSFTISTQSQVRGGAVSEPFEHTSGIVYLTERNDSKANQNFKRFEKLVGSRRCQEIMNNPEAEMMQGKPIYRAFNNIVHYTEQFQGMKTVARVNLEATGTVKMEVDHDAPASQRLCDTPMTDSFMQFAGFLVNYFNNPSFENIFVCHEIERIEIGGSFSPDSNEWIVYSTMSEDGDRDVYADCYIFEAETKKLVMVVFGLHFTKMSQVSLVRMLKGVNKFTEVAVRGEKTVDDLSDSQNSDTPTSTEAPQTPMTSPNSTRTKLLNVLHDVTDVSLNDLKDNSTLEDLGIDSLMATEVLGDIRSALGVSIDLSTFLFFDNVRAIWTYLDKKLGNSLDSAASDYGNIPSPNSPSRPILSQVNRSAILPQSPFQASTPLNVPSLKSPYEAFDEIRLTYDTLAIETKAINFWSHVYPHQSRLVLAYVVEAFEKLGCGLKLLKVDDLVPEVQSIPSNKLLGHRLYKVLEDAKLVLPVGPRFSRTCAAIDPTPAETVYQQMIELYPESSSVHKLIRVAGSNLAACLVGDEDGIQLIFGDKANKATLEDLYARWPLFETPTILLGEFLAKALANNPRGGVFQILEIGAGTGGTTRYIISHLRSLGIPFEYSFTDISTSLVAAAKKTFDGMENISFEVLDIEKSPPAKHIGAYNVIIASNCIHATRKLDESLSHLRQMLRDDGVLTLIEITRKMFWLDIVMGLFEGWWLFDDGRSHALVDEVYWERALKKAHFGSVAWTDGKTPESQTVRLIAAFPTSYSTTKHSKSQKAKSSIETVVYKKVGNTEIHADVYLPFSANPRLAKAPIALMIHGGSHMLFSRKDTRPAQTQLLLDKGFVPVSLDHRLCPEVSLVNGPMVDICDALDWARNVLPLIKFKNSELPLDGDKVVAVGWSSGGQLAMSLAWTAPQRGLRPPEAILAFYCPTNYEDEWWKSPIQPVGAEDNGADYDLLEGVQDEPITNYCEVGAWEPLSDPRIHTDPRFRLLLHINWKAQTLPVILGGLPSKNTFIGPDMNELYHMPQPTTEKIIPASPVAQIIRGNYRTPTFFIHGTKDELIPWQQTKQTCEALIGRGISSDIIILEGAPHICDLSTDPESAGWKAVLAGYSFISSYVI